MVRIEGTKETTRDGMKGTIYTLRIVGFTDSGARAHARGALAGRFPVNIGKIEVVEQREVESEFPGLPETEVDVFMPYNNPSNPSRGY